MNALNSPYPPSPRVALFSGNYNYVRDGANQALNRLVEYLLRQGAAVRIYSPTCARPAFAHAGDVVSVPSIPIPRRTEYRFATRLPDAIKHDLAVFRPNLIHLSTPDYLGYRALQLAQDWDIPVVASVHTRFDTYFKYYGLGWCERVVKRYLRHIYSQCQQIYAPTDSMAQVLREDRMCNDVRIWSRGVDSKLYDPERRDLAWRRVQGIADDEVVVAFVGRLVLEKGLGVFADTIDILRRQSRTPRVLVVGDGPERESFKQRLPGAIFTGFQEGDALARAYASADVFFNPSTTETFGNVTLEAMASGLPTVCAKATGSVSLVQHGVTGYLAERNAALEYASFIGRLAAETERRRDMGAASRRQSLQHNWDRTLHEVLVNYREILEAAARPSGVRARQLAIAT